MWRSWFIAPLLLAALPSAVPPPQAPAVQTGRWVKSELNDWLPGTFTNTYVDGSALRLQPEQTSGEFELGGVSGAV